ncbi:hypothetical protein R3P38DRAFT_3217436 [Favolaschia claudopus]|uniref:Uncharacterized protein n=1 Tax=Favolaschia claudopus TaxID=2862362 RepID=A0AAW0A5T3_9AGAR
MHQQSPQATPASTPDVIGDIAPITSVVIDEGKSPSSLTSRQDGPEGVRDDHGAIEAITPGALASLSPTSLSNTPHPSAAAVGRLRSASWTVYSEVDTRNESNIVSSHSLTAAPQSAQPGDSPLQIAGTSPLSYIPQSSHQAVERPRPGPPTTSKRVTVEEVDDDGDLPQSTAQRRPRKTKEKPVSKITIRRSRRHFSTSSSPVGETSHVEDGDALRPRSKPKAPGSAASAHSGSQSYVWPGTQTLAPSAISPYPPSLLNDYSGSRDETVMSDTQRAIRRSEKDCAVGSSSTDDAEQGRGRRTIAPSPVNTHGSDSEPEPLSFIRKKGKNLAEEALARERARTDNTAEARQRREDAERGLRRLKDLRVEDDTEYAERLVVQEITELESLQFAQMQAKENCEYSQRVLELQREAAEEEEKSRVLDETALAAVRAAREQHDRTKARQKAVEASIANEKKARVASAALEPQARSREQPENDSIRLIPWKDRVAGQQMRLSQLKERGYSLFQDMKIGFTASGEPIDLDSVQILSGGSRTNAQPPQPDSIKVEMSREEKPSVPVEPNVYEKGNSKPPQPSDEGDSSSESSRSRKKSKRKGRHTSYRSDSNYTRSEDTDSAFGNSSDAESSSKKRRKSRRKRDSSPSDSSSSSSESSYSESDSSVGIL